MDIPSYLKYVVTKLSGEIGVRSYRNSAQMERAACFIEAEFVSLGLPVTDQRFTYKKQIYKNLIARTGTSRKHGRTIIIGAHYDTVHTTPGADDNASGIAGVLGMAKLLTAAPLNGEVRFVGFALEEPPIYRTRNMGSYHYAKYLHDENESIDGMICLEMIGYFNDGDGSQRFPLPFMKRWFPKAGNFIAMVGNRRSSTFTRVFAEAFRRGTDLPLYTLNAPAVMVGIDFSDHWSFGKFGYRAFMVTDTSFYRNRHYHSSSDLPETLDYNRMAKVVEGVTAAVREWGLSESFARTGGGLHMPRP